MHFCVAMHVLLVASSGLFSRKNQFICVAILVQYLGSVSEMPALAGEVKRSSSELKSDLLQTVEERLPLLFHRKVLFLLTKPQHTLFTSCDHCTGDPTGKYQKLDLVIFFVKIQLSSLYVKSQTSKGLLSYFHFFAKTEKRGTGSSVGTVREQQDLWEAVTQTIYRDYPSTALQFTLRNFPLEIFQLISAVAICGKGKHSLLGMARVLCRRELTHKLKFYTKQILHPQIKETVSKAHRTKMPMTHATD